MLKIESDLPELRPLHTQNTIKIVPVIFPVIHNICDPGADRFFAQIDLGYSHLPALECSTDVGNILCPERLETSGIQPSTLKQHVVRATRVDHETSFLLSQAHTYCYDRCIGVERGREGHGLNRTEKDFPIPVVNGETAF